jgi:hypothetical protein
MPAVVIQPKPKFGCEYRSLSNSFSQPTGQLARSKILLSIVYLWTGRGPEINNGMGAASGRR